MPVQSLDVAWSEAIGPVIEQSEFAGVVFVDRAASR